MSASTGPQRALVVTESGWMDDAACRGEPPDDWFPEGSEWERRAPTQRAKAVCARCPVAQDCLDYAMANHLVGIWGGRDDKERRRLQRLARQVK